jgi:MtrB/PioB family decaheme-associated outer membrane protein
MLNVRKQVTAALACLSGGAAICALVAMPQSLVAAEKDPDVEALTQPANFFEIGAEDVSSASDKFGEYNGLNKSGGYAIGNFDWRDGDAYNGYDGGTGNNRWGIQGSDLGTTSRTISAMASQQGTWNVGFGYDELRHYITNTYQTPFQGSMGGNQFLLPGSFGVIDATQFALPGTGTQALTPTQLAAFHGEDVYTDRKNYSVTARYRFNLEWNLQFSYNRLDQSGAKLIGGSFSPDAGGNGAGEDSGTFMNPTNFKTDTFEFSVNHSAERWHMTASYFASLFTDAYGSVSFSNPFVSDYPAPSQTGTLPPGGVFPVDVYATPPNNEFQQLNFMGGYAISPATTLTGGLSYARNTQNASFIADPLFTSVLPQGSLDGLVVTSHADLKLTNIATERLTLTATAKFNERDNRTKSETFGSFVSIAGDQWGSVVNAPLSNRRTEGELAANYRIDRRQTLRFSYDFEAINRWCNNGLANNAQSSDPAAPTGYYNMAACVEVPHSTDNRLSAKYTLRAASSIRLNAGYTYSDRHANINSSYYNPEQTSGQGYQNLGFVPWFDASRKEQLVKAGISWDPTEKLDIGLDGRYVDDSYGSVLGVQHGSLWAANLDSTYNYSENFSVSAYLTLQGRERSLLSADASSPTAPPTDLWANRLRDDSDTVGLTAKLDHLLHGKLNLVADLSHSSDRSVYTTTLVNYTSELCTPEAIECGTLPTIRNESLRFKFGAIYAIRASDKLALHYVYAKLTSQDYYYSAYQLGSTNVVVMPTNQAAPNYSVNVVGLSFIHNFH